LESAASLAEPSELLVRGALRLAPHDHLVIVEDEASRSIGDAIARAADAAGAWVRRIDLDRFARRPVRLLPDLTRQALDGARASVFLAGALPQEASVRQAILHLVRANGLRHAHLPGITERGFVAGLRTSCEDLARIGGRVQRAANGARTILSESAGGTSLRIELDAGCAWFAQLGVIRPGEWASFPAGAIYASPARVDGVFVADACVGEFFGTRAGLLAGRGVRLRFEHGYVVEVDAPDDELLRDLRATLQVAANSNRVGLVAIGVNAGLVAPVGDAAIDQNMPGLHLGIGDPDARSSGAQWRAQTCFAACQVASSVTVDGVEIIRRGVLVGPSVRATPAPTTTSAARLVRTSTPFPST
jgi:leucyl aminopeptidase (aminopeptidase T)